VPNNGGGTTFKGCKKLGTARSQRSRRRKSLEASDLAVCFVAGGHFFPARLNKTRRPPVQTKRPRWLKLTIKTEKTSPRPADSRMLRVAGSPRPPTPGHRKQPEQRHTPAGLSVSQHTFIFRFNENESDCQ